MENVSAGNEAGADPTGEYLLTLILGIARGPSKTKPPPAQEYPDARDSNPYAKAMSRDRTLLTGITDFKFRSEEIKFLPPAALSSKK